MNNNTENTEETADQPQSLLDVERAENGNVPSVAAKRSQKPARRGATSSIRTSSTKKAAFSPSQAPPKASISDPLASSRSIRNSNNLPPTTLSAATAATSVNSHDIASDSSSSEELRDARIAVKIVRERIAFQDGRDGTAFTTTASTTPTNNREEKDKDDLLVSSEDYLGKPASSHERGTGLHSSQLSPPSLVRDNVHGSRPITSFLGRKPTPGAVRVSGLNHPSGGESDFLRDSTEYGNPPGSSKSFFSDNKDHSPAYDLQNPPPSTPFEPEVPLEATLVNNDPSSAMSTRNLSSSLLLVEAKPMDQSELHHRAHCNVNFKDIFHNRRICFGISTCMLVVIAAAVGIVLGVVLPQTGSGAAPLPPPRPENSYPPPPFEIHPPFSQELESGTLDDITYKPDSPAYRANAWMINDPHLENYDQERSFRRFGLAALFYSLHGQNWYRNDHWLDYNYHECEWYSAHHEPHCTSNNTSFLTLNLTSNNLQGLAPREFPYIQMNHTLDLSNNSIQGILPTMGRMALMQVVDISNNQLSGKLTVELGWSSSFLRVLNISGNVISGPIPTAVSNLAPNAVSLDFSRNQFVGSILDNIVGNQHLRFLSLAENNLDGTLPKSFVNFPSLEFLNISGNGVLGGTIPEEFSLMRNLTLLDISATSVTGSIPEDLCQLEQIGILDIRADCQDDTFQCCLIR